MAEKIFVNGDRLPATTQLRISWSLGYLKFPFEVKTDGGNFYLVEHRSGGTVYINNIRVYNWAADYFIAPYDNYDHNYIDIDTSTWSESKRTVSYYYPNESSSYYGDFYLFWEDLAQAPSGYTITFNSYGDSSISPINNATNLPTPLPTPTKSGYIFVNWYYDSALTQIASPGDPIESNVTLYAGWRTTMQTSIRIYNGTTWFTLDGYSSYDCLNSLTYVNAPERTIGGTIPNLSSIPTFIVTTLFITYKLMPYQTYKDFINHINNKVEFVIEYFDVDTGLMKTKKFYLAPQSQRELFYARRGGVRSINGILNITLEFISTNNEV